MLIRFPVLCYYVIKLWRNSEYRKGLIITPLYLMGLGHGYNLWKGLGI